MKTIRLTTFNIQHGRLYQQPGDVIDLAKMAEVADGTGATVFGFNEVRKGPSDGSIKGYPDTPAVLSRLLGGQAVFGHAVDFGPGRGYGNLLISRVPILESDVIPIQDPDPRTGDQYYETRNIIRTKIDCGECRLTVMVSHFGLNTDEQENAVSTVIRLLEREKGPVVLMGDLNLCPDSPFYSRLASCLTDAAAAAGIPEPTFPSDAPERRIDYIFIRSARAAEAHVVPIVASDHRALTAEIELPAR